jgi:hypothetical protein
MTCKIYDHRHLIFYIFLLILKRLIFLNNIKLDIFLNKSYKQTNKQVLIIAKKIFYY